MLDYRLKVFRAVAENLNFTRAAEQLHISQPAVTQHVKLLEEHYGTPLFRRSAGGIALTPAGAVVLAAASQTAALERQVETRLRSGQTELSGALRLGASTTIAQYFVPAVIARFQTSHPRVELTLRIGNTREVVDGLAAGRLDLGLIEGPASQRDVQTEAFYTDEIVAIAAPRHPLAAQSTVRPADLARTTFILREPGSGTRAVVERELRRVKVNPKRLNVRLETDSSEVIKRLVSASDAVAFMSKLAIVAELRAGDLRVLPVTGLRILREFHFVYPQGPRSTGIPGAFMATLQKAAARERGEVVSDWEI